MLIFLREIPGTDTQFAAKRTPQNYVMYHSMDPALEMHKLLGPFLARRVALVTECRRTDNGLGGTMAECESAHSAANNCGLGMKWRRPKFLTRWRWTVIPEVANFGISGRGATFS
jgi:hypothetical protein